VRSPSDFRELTEVVEIYGPSIFRYAFAYLKNRQDAEDITQEVLCVYLYKAPAFESDEKRKHWLLRVTGNRCKNLLKSAWRRKTVALPEDIPAPSEETGDLLRYVLSLDEKYRIPLHLYYYEGYAIAEIAGLLHRSPATVGTWLARGRALLRSVIGDDNFA